MPDDVRADDAEVPGAGSDINESGGAEVLGDGSNINESGPAMLPRKRKRPILFLLVIGVACLAAVAATAGLIVYNQATALDRSTPDVAVDQFLHAAAVQRDSTRVSLFVCGEWPSGDALREATNGINKDVEVSWLEITISRLDGNRATAIVSVQLTFSDAIDVERWQFDVVDEQGWRVCGLRRERPTPATTFPPSPPQ